LIDAVEAKSEENSPFLKSRTLRAELSRQIASFLASSRKKNTEDELFIAREQFYKMCFVHFLAKYHEKLSLYESIKIAEGSLPLSFRKVENFLKENLTQSKYDNVTSMHEVNSRVLINLITPSLKNLFSPEKSLRNFGLKDTLAFWSSVRLFAKVRKLFKSPYLSGALTIGAVTTEFWILKSLVKFISSIVPTRFKHFWRSETLRIVTIWGRTWMFTSLIVLLRFYQLALHLTPGSPLLRLLERLLLIVLRLFIVVSIRSTVSLGVLVWFIIVANYVFLRSTFLGFGRMFKFLQKTYYLQTLKALVYKFQSLNLLWSSSTNYARFLSEMEKIKYEKVSAIQQPSLEDEEEYKSDFGYDVEVQLLFKTSSEAKFELVTSFNIFNFFLRLSSGPLAQVVDIENSKNIRLLSTEFVVDITKSWTSTILISVQSLSSTHDDYLKESIESLFLSYMSFLRSGIWTIDPDTKVTEMSSKVHNFISLLADSSQEKLVAEWIRAELSFSCFCNINKAIQNLQESRARKARDFLKRVSKEFDSDLVMKLMNSNKSVVKTFYGHRKILISGNEFFKRMLNPQLGFEDSNSFVVEFRVNDDDNSKDEANFLKLLLEKIYCGRGAVLKDSSIPISERNLNSLAHIAYFFWDNDLKATTQHCATIRAMLTEDKVSAKQNHEISEQYELEEITIQK
jgi:hypothetical protein